jgi:hypothetical protein
VHFTRIKPGRLLLFPLGSKRLVVIGFTLLSIFLMVLLNALRSDWLQNDTHKHMVLIDYLETFSPTAHLNFVRISLFVVTSRSWPLYKPEIKNAFLRGNLNEEVYMDQPPGYVVAGSEHLECLLLKALYGLKQSPHAWFDRFNALYLDMGSSALF